MQNIIIIHQGTILQKSKTDSNFEKVKNDHAIMPLSQTLLAKFYRRGQGS